MFIFAIDVSECAVFFAVVLLSINVVCVIFVTACDVCAL